jgi:hypothetical protein
MNTCLDVTKAFAWLKKNVSEDRIAMDSSVAKDIKSALNTYEPTKESDLIRIIFNFDLWEDDARDQFKALVKGGYFDAKQ